MPGITRTGPVIESVISTQKVPYLFPGFSTKGISQEAGMQKKKSVLPGSLDSYSTRSSTKMDR